jgi:hypothetical protein
LLFFFPLPKLASKSKSSCLWLLNTGGMYHMPSHNHLLLATLDLLTVHWLI